KTNFMALDPPVRCSTPASAPWRHGGRTPSTPARITRHRSRPPGGRSAADVHCGAPTRTGNMTGTAIGILGGSGLYHMEGLEHIQETRVDTPFGTPSDVILTGVLGGTRVAFLARHGRGHHLLPSEIPYRANIHALKQLGVRYLLSFSAVGSLQEQIAPLDFVVPDQYIDLTKHRQSTFFGAGVVAHVAMANPVCEATSEVLTRAAASVL